MGGEDLRVAALAGLQLFEDLAQAGAAVAADGGERAALGVGAVLGLRIEALVEEGLDDLVDAEVELLELRLDEQVLVAYEGDQTVFVTRVSSGARFSSGDYATPDGRFITNRKRPTRHMAAGDPANPTSYDLPGVPWVSYLTKSGISFHGTYWHNDFGRPRSHGCVNLISTAALWVYRWTTPVVPLDTIYWEEEDGTQVDIYKKTPKTV